MAKAFQLTALLILTSSFIIPTHLPAQSAEQRVELSITGGHDTDPRDRGRPDVLIAAALGVPTEVFRDAFSHVRPLHGETGDNEAQVRQNKAALMHALGPYGITDERLNQVSNYYRYSREHGQEVWRITPAKAFAVIRNGVIERVTITDAGSGYSSPPAISVPQMPDSQLAATLVFGKDFAKNGSIAQIAVTGK